MGRLEEIRLITRVATLYHERKLRQAEIAEQLEISQATVSRLLRRAEEEGIVRITVSAPLGVYSQLEEELKDRFGLREVIVVEGSEDEGELLRHLGAAAAFYLETTIRAGEQIGLSSWSASLLAMANAMRPVPRISGVRVGQILGGVGNPAAASHAVQLTRGLARLVHGEIIMLPAPGVVGNAGAREVLLEDPFVREAVDYFDTITLALVGIGALDPSPVLARSGNAFTEEELEELRRIGAVGDLCLRFYDLEGVPVETSLNDRVIGMTLEQLRRARRSVGIAGGERKLAAILGALRGGWINVLVTDHRVAQKLLAGAPEANLGAGSDAVIHS